MRKIAIVGGLLVLVLAVAASPLRAQQDKSKRPSPPATAKCELAGGKTVTIDYSSPRKKGRNVFPDVVKYGEVWRTGANEATTFVTTGDVMVGSTHVPAGSYTLFTVPGKDKWTLIISKKTGEWGTDYPGEKEDLARVEMTRALNALLDRLPNVRLDPGQPPPVVRGTMMRVPRHLHVVFDR